MTTTLTKQQARDFGPRFFTEHGREYRITAHVRHDDSCGNGHNSFAITATIDEKSRGRWVESAGGMCHGEIARHFPELAPLLQWHLCSTDGPMHYIANARYWAGFSGYRDGKPNSPPNAEHLRSTIVFGAVPQWDDGRTPEEMDDDDLTQWLNNRMPDLLAEFQKAVESLGFTY